MKIDFASMKEGAVKKVYEELWKENDLPAEVCQTWDSRSSTFSKNSYTFTVEGIDQKHLTESDEGVLREGLKKIFKLDAVQDYDEKFHSACFGKGNEYTEILRLHSSALCSFLFFSSISEKNPLTLSIEGKPSIFTTVLFEYKDTVIKSSAPSCIDIVLVSQDRKTILFLESKFSEYLSSNEPKISIAYKTEYPELYNTNFLQKFGFAMKDKDAGYFTIYPTQGKCYSEGIKQLISHYIGLEHFVNNDFCDDRSLPENAEVYLGEILFDFSFAESKEKLAAYTETYKKVAKELNGLQKGSHVLSEPLKYSLFKDADFTLSAPIRSFYFGAEN